MAQVRLLRRADGTGSEALDHVLTVMREQVDLIRSHEAGARAGSDPEEVHEMRTAVRRLRAFLRALRDVFDRPWVESLRSELDWLGEALGAVRDLDVLRDHLREELAALEDVADPSAPHHLFRCFDVEHSRARSKLLAALDSPRYRGLLSRLDQAARHPRALTADFALAEIAARQFKRARKAAKALSGEPSDRELHDVRIKVKHARYAAELAEEEVGNAAARFADKAKKLQDVLGEHQDAVVAEARIRVYLRGVRGATSLRNRLVERQRERRRKARKVFWKKWP